MKKQYKVPDLESLGSLDELTQGTIFGIRLDGDGGFISQHGGVITVGGITIGGGGHTFS